VLVAARLQAFAKDVIAGTFTVTARAQTECKEDYP